MTLDCRLSVWFNTRGRVCFLETIALWIEVARNNTQSFISSWIYFCALSFLLWQIGENYLHTGYRYLRFYQLKNIPISSWLSHPGAHCGFAFVVLKVTQCKKGYLHHNWASLRENLSSEVCEQQRRRPACAPRSLISAFVIRLLKIIISRLALIS